MKKMIKIAFVAKIPSDSMEPSLLAGDCILVDKCSGGARLFNVLEHLQRLRDMEFMQIRKQMLCLIWHWLI